MLYFSIQNASPRRDGEGLRGGGCEMTIGRRMVDRMVLGWSSDGPRMVVESSFYWRKQFRDFPLKSGTQDFVAGAVSGEVRG